MQSFFAKKRILAIAAFAIIYPPAETAILCALNKYRFPAFTILNLMICVLLYLAVAWFLRASFESKEKRRVYGTAAAYSAAVTAIAFWMENSPKVPDTIHGYISFFVLLYPPITLFFWTPIEPQRLRVVYVTIFSVAYLIFMGCITVVEGLGITMPHGIDLASVNWF